MTTELSNMEVISDHKKYFTRMVGTKPDRSGFSQWKGKNWRQ